MNCVVAFINEHVCANISAVSFEGLKEVYIRIFYISLGEVASI